MIKWDFIPGMQRLFNIPKTMRDTVISKMKDKNIMIFSTDADKYLTNSISIHNF